MWEKFGMSRNKIGLQSAIGEIRELRKEFYKSVSVPGSATNYNEELAQAGCVADFYTNGDAITHSFVIADNDATSFYFHTDYITMNTVLLL